MTSATTTPEPLRRSDLFMQLAALGIATQTVEHAPLFTVEQSSKIEQELALDGAPTKNLFLKDAKGQLYLVIAHAHTRVDLKRLPGLIGSARLSFGSAGLLGQVLGVQPGAVTAFAVINDQDGKVALVFDQALMGFERINCHPLENTATTNIARDDLLRFIRATGHEPRIAALSSGAAIPGV